MYLELSILFEQKSCEIKPSEASSYSNYSKPHSLTEGRRPRVPGPMACTQVSGGLFEFRGGPEACGASLGGPGPGENRSIPVEFTQYLVLAKM